MFCLFKVSVDETDVWVLGVYYSFFDAFLIVKIKMEFKSLGLGCN